MKNKNDEYFKAIDIINMSRRLNLLLELNKDNKYLTQEMVKCLNEKCSLLDGDIIISLKNDGYTVDQMIEDFHA